jgi:hypothetical protein
MLALISYEHNARSPLQYNEIKVTEGKAEVIWAENFVKGLERLNLDDKLARFGQRTSLNERAENKMVHISVNFGKTEELSNERMREVGRAYMKEMKFGDQPYLFYRHFDAGHTHMHIVATNIRADGSQIKIGKKEVARSHEISRRLEKEFSLQRSRRSGPEERALFEVDHAQKVIYGEPGLKRAVSDVLNTVVDHYRYSSLDELNAVLRLYNVEANNGQEGSRLRAVGGILYHALDESGNRIGKPIKASLFHLKPTLKHLEQRFQVNRDLGQEAKERIATAIEWSLSGRPPNWECFRESLAQRGISVVPADEGKLYFVDHREKAVFDSKAVANDYEAGSLRNRCAPEVTVTEEQELKQQLNLGL